MRLQRLVTEGNDIQKPLWLWPVICDEMLSSKNHNADIFGKIAHFGSVECQIIPPFYFRLEIVVKK